MRGLRFVALAAAVLSAGFSLAGDGVLYWMIDSTATVAPADGGADVSIADFFSSFESGTAFAARVRVTGESITGDTFLDLYYEDVGFVSGDYGLDFDGTNVGTPFGAKVGVPAVYSSGSPEYSFMVEIGNIVDDRWTTVAQSSSEQYSSLVASQYIQPIGNIGTPTPTAIWTPSHFAAIPEPTSGLLALLGAAVLALRRRRVV